MKFAGQIRFNLILSGKDLANKSGKGVLMSKNYVCTNCGFVGEPKRYTKGSLGWEILLWVLGILPGLFYSIWRLSTRYHGCPKYEYPYIVPENSPRGQEIIKKQQ